MIQFLERITEYSDPERFESKDNHLRPLFAEIQAQKASDIFIQVGRPVTVLVQNKLYAVTRRSLHENEAQWFLIEFAGATALTAIGSRDSINTSYSLFENSSNSGDVKSAYEKARNSYRVNASGISWRGKPAFQIVLRTIPSKPIRYDDLGIPLEFIQRCCPTNGIVLIAGVTGSGKSTTLAAIIRYILENNTPIQGNILTHEEPIEYTYDQIESNHSIVVQSQIPENFASFHAANREAMRRKPAAILVGELRDAETISSAMEASLTGHPVFATVHAGSVVDIVSRLLTKFESNKLAALYDFISTASMLIAQRLVPDVKGKLFAVREHLYLTDEIKNHIKKISDPNEVNNFILETMKNGSNDPSSIASLTFEKQGEILFENGSIDANGLIWLKGQS